MVTFPREYFEQHQSLGNSAGAVQFGPRCLGPTSLMQIE